MDRPAEKLYAAARLIADFLCPGITEISLKLLNGKKVKVSVIDAVPVDSGQQQVSECGQDIIDLLTAKGQRMTGEEIKAELERTGKMHGDSTVQRTLAELCRRKFLLTNNRDQYGKGYGLTEWN